MMIPIPVTSWRRRRIWLCSAAWAAIAGGPELRAQTTPPADTTRQAKVLFTTTDAALAAGFAGLTVAMFPVDRSIARRLQDSSTQASRFLKNASKGIQYFADPGSVRSEEHTSELQSRFDLVC